MTEDRWDKIGKLLEEVRDVRPEERGAYLEEMCELESVRKEVLSLLEAEEQAGGFFDDLLSALPTGASGEESRGGRPLPSFRSSDPLALEGTTVGRYAVEECLGGGGMGVVYKARDPQLGRTVALKFLPPHLTTSEEAERRFVREARAASALEHPHIATIYEIDKTEDGHRFIAMAYYEGETLKEKLSRKERLPPEEAVHYAEQIADALARAHDAGIVHRDVKPANVMVTEAGEVKLLDFGLAKAAAGTRLTEPGRLLGTAVYMSPEQAEGDQVGPPTDVWALGIVLYEMLTGVQPFQGGRNTAVLRAILHDEPTPLTAQRDDLPPALGRIVDQCLQKNPGDRYSSAEVLVDDLRTLQLEGAKATTAQEEPLGRSAGESVTGLLAKIQRLVEELRRRRVLRMAAIYAGTGFVVLQLGEILVQPFGLPTWTLRLVTMALILGFPFVVVLTWVFDITEQGVVRTRSRSVPRENQRSEARPRLSNVGLLVLLVVGIVGFGWAGWETWIRAEAQRFPPEGRDEVPEELGQSATSGNRSLNLDPATVAVLYFDDNSTGDTLTAFASGFTEHLIHRLTQVDGLEVVSQHGVEPYRESRPPMDSIAQRLGAGSLITGSIDPVGDSLAVFVRLINGETQSHLMSEYIRRPAKKVFTLQKELVQEVSRLLRKRLGRELKLETWQAETQSAEAWRLVERAERIREDARQLEWEDQLAAAREVTAQADSLLAKASSLDPEWSAPTALRARLVTVRVDPYAQSWSERERNTVRQGIRYANEALRLDSTNSQALIVRGRLRFWLSQRVDDPDRSQKLADRAERDLRRAIRGAPHSARAMYTLSRLLQMRGNFGQASHYAERARQADAYLRIPSDTHYQMFDVTVNAENFEEAARWCRTGQEQYPELVDFRNCELALLATEGAMEPDVARAWELVEEIRARTAPENKAFYEALSLSKVAAVLARTGQPDSARTVLRQARRDTGRTPPLVHYQRAHAYLLLGEEERALDLLSRSVEQNPQYAAQGAKDPWFKALRDRPRFQDIVNR